MSLQTLCSALQILRRYSIATATLQKSRKLQLHYIHTTARRMHYSTTPRYSMDGMCSAAKTAYAYSSAKVS